MWDCVVCYIVVSVVGMAVALFVQYLGNDYLSCIFIGILVVFLVVAITFAVLSIIKIYFRKILNEEIIKSPSVIQTTSNLLLKSSVIMRHIISDVTVTLLGLLILSPVVMLFYQIYFYLQTGKSFSLSIIDLLIYFNNSWAIYPTNWLGLWNVLDKLNPVHSLIIPPLLFLFLIILSRR
jgi:hypothetical protein